MAYLFDDFKNIKTFPAATRVYRDGFFMPDLSDGAAGADLPLHIIHVGRISGAQNWIVDMREKRKVFLTARIETGGAANIRIEINPALPDLEFEGRVFIKNAGNLVLNIIGNNLENGTKIKCRTKLFAMAGGANDLSGLANIPAGVMDAETDIGFSALCDRGVKMLKISPAQRISSIPESAGHSASIYRPAPPQIRYLETAGLSGQEAAELLNRVFLEEAE
jgi:hypothetical protein